MIAVRSLSLHLICTRHRSLKPLSNLEGFAKKEDRRHRSMRDLKDSPLTLVINMLSFARYVGPVD